MASLNSLYESAHKGDYNLVKCEIDEKPDLALKEDDVSKTFSIIVPSSSEIFRMEEYCYTGQLSAVM